MERGWHKWRHSHVGTVQIASTMAVPSLLPAPRSRQECAVLMASLHIRPPEAARVVR